MIPLQGGGGGVLPYMGYRGMVILVINRVGKIVG